MIETDRKLAILSPISPPQQSFETIFTQQRNYLKIYTPEKQENHVKFKYYLST